MKKAAARSAGCQFGFCDPILTGYDEQHLITYLRLLDCRKQGADWRGEGRQVILKIDPDSHPRRLERRGESTCLAPNG